MPVTMPQPQRCPTPAGPCPGGRLVSADGRTLPLVAARLSAEAGGGIARCTLNQVFANPHPDPLQVTYQLPLPHQGAVSGFSFRLGERRVVGEVDLIGRARQRFEAAVLSGRTAALLDQERGSLFAQELGNVPPGAQVEAEIVVDQRLDWRDEGAWEWRFPTVVAPRYAGAEGRVPDAGRIAVEVTDGRVAPRLALSLTVRDPLPAGRRPESPSHALSFSEAGGLLRAELGGAQAHLDRDLVVRWPAAATEVGISLRAGPPEGGRLSGRAFGLLTVTPPQASAHPASLPRDLVVLLDVSGSMSGEPLDQARRVISALVDSLDEEDQLELVAFGSTTRRWRRGPAPATRSVRRDALAWLARLQAGGGTEMREGIRQALGGVRAEAQRQVVLVTDGLIGFEQEVVAEILATLPAGTRLHTVGVGSSVNRSLTGPAARAGRGLEVVIGLGEDPERAALALRARTAAPLVTELSICGTALVASAPARLPDLFAGAPALLALELAPGGGSLELRGRTADGELVQRLEVAPATAGVGSPAAAALFGRESVEDLEMRLAAGDPGETVDRAEETLGLDFQISTRLTSWVAVSEEPTVDPTRPVRRERIPQELPHGLSVEGLGLRPAATVLGGPPAPMSAVPAREAAKATTPRRRARIAQSLRAPEMDQVVLPPDASLEMRGEELLRPVRLVARLRHAGDGLLAVEAEVVDGPLPWRPPTRARVVLDDGTEMELEVDPAATTAPAQLGPGQSLRLVLRLPPGPWGRRAREVRVKLAGLDLVLAVEG